jgi:hypothetical protein
MLISFFLVNRLDIMFITSSYLNYWYIRKKFLKFKFYFYPFHPKPAKDKFKFVQKEYLFFQHFCFDFALENSINGP